MVSRQKLKAPGDESGAVQQTHKDVTKTLADVFVCCKKKSPDSWSGPVINLVIGKPMTNTNVVDFSSKRNGGQPVIADIENGYCKLANDLLDAICRLDTSGSQFQLLMAIVRCTYGYNKKQDKVTNTYLAELTGLGLTAVKSGLQSLVARQIITIEKSGMFKMVAINKTVSDWLATTGKKEANSRKKAANATSLESRERDHNKPRTRPVEAANATTISRERDHTKDNLNTTNQIQPTKDSRAAAANKLDYSRWPNLPSELTMKDWLAFRKTKRAPVNQTVVNRLAPQLVLAVAAGWTVDDCLAECMNRGWTGFEFQWLHNVRSSPSKSSVPHQFNTQNYERGQL